MRRRCVVGSAITVGDVARTAANPAKLPKGMEVGLTATSIFYADVEDFGRLNEVYARHMPDPPPARSAPANVRLPHGLLVSIEAIAVLPRVSP